MIYLGILSEIYSEPFGHPLTVFALRPILDVWKSRESREKSLLMVLVIKQEQ